MKSIFVICTLLCISLATAEICGDGRSFCRGIKSCCRSGNIYKCSPFNYAVCCPGGNYSCPAGRRCVRVSNYYVCVGRSTTKKADSLSEDKTEPEFLASFAKVNPDSSLDQKV